MYYFFELFFLVISLSLDTLAAGISMGIEKIKVPISSILILNFISTFFLVFSCLASSQFYHILPKVITTYFTPFLFLFLGISKILEGLHKIIPEKEYFFHLSNIDIIFKIYKKPSTADLDYSKTLSIKELILLGIALSIDNLVIGLGMGIWSNMILFIILLHFIFGTIFFTFFNRFTLKIPISNKINSSLISGSILMIVGIYHIFV